MRGLDIIDKVDELLKERGLTAKALAEGIDVSTGNISDWRSRRAKPSVEALLRIADYFGVSVDSLLGRDEKNFEQPLSQKRFKS